jgi:hypothetical protein
LQNNQKLYEDPSFTCSHTKSQMFLCVNKIKDLKDQIELEKRDHKNVLIGYDRSIERWKHDIDLVIIEVKGFFLIEPEFESCLKEANF